MSNLVMRNIASETRFAKAGSALRMNSPSRDERGVEADCRFRVALEPEVLCDPYHCQPYSKVQ